jgi:hypothetical protein
MGTPRRSGWRLLHADSRARGGPAGSPEGFCLGCKRVYDASRLAREQALADTARMLGLANPGWRETFAAALPGQYELMLLHAAAHHLQYGGSVSDAVSLYALHDYLDDTMDRVRGHTGEGSS